MPRIGAIVALALLTILPASAGRAQSPAASSKADALSEAARRGDAAAVKRLLDEGVDVNTKFRYGATALSYASDRGHVEVVRLLLDRGADVNVTDTFYNATPLTWAVSPAISRKPEHAQVVRLLVEHGAKGQDQALLAAVGGGDVATTRAILDVGKVSAETASEALESARAASRVEIVALLEKAGAKPLVDYKLTEAEFARLIGTYRSAAGSDLVFVVANGRLTGGPAGQRSTFVARSATMFSALGIPGLTLTFRVEDGKATAVTVGQPPNSSTYNRVESSK